MAIKNAALDLKNRFLETFTTKDNVNDIWIFIKEEIGKIIENLVPTKMTSSRYHQPWITTETKRLCRKKKR